MRQARNLIASGTNRFGKYQRVYHVHLRKSAGTSINAAFWALGGLSLKSIKREPIAIRKKRIFVRNNLQLINEGNYHYGNSHIPYWRLSLPKNTFVFCMVRDPLERLLSLYRYYLWIDQVDAREGMKQEPYYKSLKAKMPYLGNSFLDFAENLASKHLMNQLYLFSEMLDVEVALKNINQLDRVYFQDQFDSAITDLSDSLEIPLEIKMERKYKTPEVHINETEKSKAKVLLEREYRFYNALKQNTIKV